MDGTYFACADRVKEKLVGGDLALYVESRRSIHVLNPAARVIWESLKEPLTFEELLIVLEHTFTVPNEILRRDLEEALALFKELDLLQTISG